MKLSNTISNDKKSKIDVFREGAKITNAMTGIGNTVTDAIATTAYWDDTDFDAPLYQYLAAVFFDKRIDRKKKK
jgi:Ca2+-binding RTX toxin-like protein